MQPHDKDHAEYGFCHRHAPHTANTWPMVKVEVDWCGEFKAREDGEKSRPEAPYR